MKHLEDHDWKMIFGDATIAEAKQMIGWFKCSDMRKAARLGAAHDPKVIRAMIAASGGDPGIVDRLRHQPDGMLSGWVINRLANVIRAKWRVQR